MELHNLTHVQQLPVSIDAAWAFFSSPGNLALFIGSGNQMAVQVKQLIKSMFLHITTNVLSFQEKVAI